VIKLNLDKQTLQKLKLLNDAVHYDFLSFRIDLATATMTDKISNGLPENVSKTNIQILSDLFTHYSLSKPTPPAGKLVKFKDLPGGHAYEGAFVKRAIEPITEVFGAKPEQLVWASKRLGVTQLELGDVSIEVTPLRGIPLTYILWRAEEFASEATILYDESASNYLPTEDLGVLGEITTARLVGAYGKLSM
jgi:hypothetical protein